MLRCIIISIIIQSNYIGMDCFRTLDTSRLKYGLNFTFHVCPLMYLIIYAKFAIVC